MYRYIRYIACPNEKSFQYQDQCCSEDNILLKWVDEYCCVHSEVVMLVCVCYVINTTHVLHHNLYYTLHHNLYYIYIIYYIGGVYSNTDTLTINHHNFIISKLNISKFYL